MSDNRSEKWPKFHGLRHRSTFTVKSLENCEEPEAVLLHCFQRAVNEARENARKDNLSPDTVGVTVISKELDYDMWTPIRQYNEDTVNAVLHRFEYMNTYKENKLIESPFSVEVTCFDTNQLEMHVQENPQVTLEGHGRKRSACNLIHNTFEEGLIRINNRDNFCLFHSIETARHHVSERNRKKFQKYRDNAMKQSANVRDLMSKAGIPLNRKKYDAFQYVPKVQEYYDKIYPHTYRIYVFNKANQYKPVLATGCTKNELPLIIFHEDEEFHTIANIKTFFGIREYCFSCFRPYNTRENHTTKCGTLCMNCRRMGFGYPCETDGNSEIECNDCFKIFKNADCYQHHITNGTCPKFERCRKCGKIWNKKVNTRDGRQGHSCKESFCSKCNVFHNTDAGCFISVERRFGTRAWKRKRLDENRENTNESESREYSTDRSINSEEEVFADMDLLGEREQDNENEEMTENNKDQKYRFVYVNF